jgi:formimidoylglutamate deiminase
MANARILVADLTWVDDRFVAGVAISVDPDGKISSVGPETALEAGAPLERLPNVALLPGFINVHSHAFQRGLRGRGETFPASAGSFWTWREAMYELVSRLDGDETESLSRAAFTEMRRAGTTTVGEFHYLHHSATGIDWSLDPRILKAARDAGIRLVLLATYYRTGAVGKPLQGAQRRFESPDPESFFAQLDRLAPLLDPATQSLGVAIHSIRAASLDDFRTVYREARRRGLPVHMHVEEQRGEIDEASAVYGRPPMQVILETLGTAEAVTAIHCTHTRPRDLARFLEEGGTVALCPLTEGNLGDGIPDLPGHSERELPLCLGSDSNLRISILEDMRWLEYGQRLRRESRGLLRNSAGDSVVTLLAAATRGGSRSLSLRAGAIAPDHWADLTAIDLNHPSIARVTPETLAAAIVFGAPDSVIAGTYVGGRWESAHPDPCAAATR